MIQSKRNMTEVVEDYKAVVGSVLGVGALTSFISLLYDIMINGLGFDYVLGYLSFIILLLYPPTLLSQPFTFDSLEPDHREDTQKNEGRGFLPSPNILN
jgi:hypothetical protein